VGSPSLGKTLGLSECNHNRLGINKGKKMKDIDEQIKEDNELLKNYKKEDLNTTSSITIVIVILSGWVFALILFFIDLFVA